MTIDELLQMACEYCSDADQEAGINESMRFALVAQACAQTAQAMMAAEARQEWLEQRAADYATDRDDYAVSSH